MFDPNLLPGTVISNDQLMAIFGCGPQGGMRRAHKTDTLVLTSGHIDVVYEDR
jgi:5-methylcytosine-specific restriction enzyme A